MSRNIIITGGTGALGSAISETFLAAGDCTVHSSYINEDELDRLPASLKENPQFKTAPINLLDETVVNAWLSDLSSVDVLVNVAGGFDMGAFHEISLADWHKMFQMNVDTCFIASRAALQRMLPGGKGRIINVGAFAATGRVAGMTAYTASKAAVIKLTEDLAEETLAAKITVNAILPTIMDTPANRAAMPDADPARWVPLENVAGTVFYLSSDAAWHITGASIPLRGHC